MDTEIHPPHTQLNEGKISMAPYTEKVGLLILTNHIYNIILIYIQVNEKISNFKVEYRAGTKGKLTRSRLLVHTIYATHNNSYPK